jgi:hypothetical protein
MTNPSRCGAREKRVIVARATYVHRIRVICEK